MSPVRRPEGGAPPEYGDSRTNFSIQLNHGGFFVGTGSNRAYVDGMFVWFDYCDRFNWSVSVVHGLVEELGYEMAGRIKVYWCLPGLAVNKNGLREIKKEENTDDMTAMVTFGHHFLYLYLDHDDSMLGNKWDDVVIYPVAQLPSVLSPKKAQYVKETETKLPEFYGEGLCASNVLESNGNEKEEVCSSSDSEHADFVDSDYDWTDGDDDLFEDYVNDRGKYKWRNVAHDVDVSDDDELELPDSDDENPRYKFSTFTAAEMKDPSFRVGQVFRNVETLRQAIREYCCKNRVDIKLPINDKMRVSAICEDGCPWHMWASHDSRTKCFMVKVLCDEHTCSKKWKVKAFTAKFLANKYIETFRADENMKMRNFARVVQKEWNMTPSRSKISRARRLAMSVIYGDEIGQYNMLWDYGSEIRRSNPGSSFFLTLDDKQRFSHCYFSFDACKRGFMQGCRPVICLDGCHIKTKYGGQLLTAVGIDPNDCIYPVAFAVVEVEDTSTWRWFITALKQDLSIVNTHPWTIMSDKQKGLIKAVSELFPQAEHRFCVRHMWQNFQKMFRGDVVRNQLWKIARSTTIVDWEANMEEMKVINEDAYAWLEELPPNTWVRAFQSDFPKCDILLNNSCEVFNRYILEARELPILSMLQRIKSMLMTRIYHKQQEAQKWSGRICAKIMKKVAKNTELSNTCYVSPAGEGIFEVTNIGRTYIVDIISMSCTCRRWDLSGIPCCHAIACSRHDRIAPEDLVASCYSVETFCIAYGNIIVPCKDQKEWKDMKECPVAPPSYQKKVGRPRKNRRKQPQEIDDKKGGTKMSRHGVVIHCSHCHGSGHNKKGCAIFKAGLPPKGIDDEKITQQPDDDEPVITQEGLGLSADEGEQAMPSTSVYEHKMVDEMMQETPMTKVGEAHFNPLPDCSFIKAAHILRNPRGAIKSTNTREGNLALKSEAMKIAKSRLFAKKREAMMQSQLAATDKKGAEAIGKNVEKEVANAQKKPTIAEKKAPNARKKPAEKKAQVSQAEKRRLAAAVKKATIAEQQAANADKKAAEGEAKRQAAAEKRAAVQEAKKLAAAEKSARGAPVVKRAAEGTTSVRPKRAKKLNSMFDIFR